VELIILGAVIISLVVLDILSIRYGADSRSLGRDHLNW
jgi:hypothetical protein